MLQKLRAHIASCYERATECGRRASETTDPEGKAELLNFERSWKHLAGSYEFIEALERFLLSAHKSRIENTMIEVPSTKAKTLSNMKCDACGATMKLFGIEPHPTINDTDLQTYVCSCCDKVQTEAISIFPTVGENETITPVDALLPNPEDALLPNKAFDAETTRLLGSTFDAAWQAMVACETPLADPKHVSLLRELLAKLLIEMVTHGEKNRDRLLENALGRSVLSPPANSELPTALQASVSANVI